MPLFYEFEEAHRLNESFAQAAARFGIELKMSGCSNCMNHKTGQQSFVCPECGQEWVLAGVGPGNYYEPVETHRRDRLAADVAIRRTAVATVRSAVARIKCAVAHEVGNLSADEEAAFLRELRGIAKQEWGETDGEEDKDPKGSGGQGDQASSG